MPNLTLAHRTVLTETRKRLGLRQSDVADQCGVTQGMVAQVESGKEAPSTELLCRMADVLGLRAEVQEIVRVKLTRKGK